MENFKESISSVQCNAVHCTVHRLAWNCSALQCNTEQFWGFPSIPFWCWDQMPGSRFLLRLQPLLQSTTAVYNLYCSLHLQLTTSIAVYTCSLQPLLQSTPAVYNHCSLHLQFTTCTAVYTCSLPSTAVYTTALDCTLVHCTALHCYYLLSTEVHCRKLLSTSIHCFEKQWATAVQCSGILDTTVRV